MSKKNQAIPEQPVAVLERAPKESLSIEVSKYIRGSAYYLSYTRALEQSESMPVTPYVTAYTDAQTKHPLITPFTPFSARTAVFPKIAVEEPKKAEEPEKTEALSVSAPVQAAEKRYFRKRSVILLLIFILSLAMLAVPVLSALEVLPEYINIGVDILAVTDLFADGFALDAITGNLPLVLTALYMVFALICVLHSFIAIAGKKKKSFGILLALTLAVALAFIFASLAFDINALIEDILALNYGVYAMAACPALALILSIAAYKRLK
jgi:hypothetical protein